MKTYPTASPFSRFAKLTAHFSGHPLTFASAILLIVLWLATGSFFAYSDTWQLFINTATTVLTFLMVFVIQNTQNRDTVAIHIKLDELIRSVQGAHNALLDLEELSQGDLDLIRASYEKLAQIARAELQAGRIDTDSPEVKL